MTIQQKDWDKAAKIFNEHFGSEGHLIYVSAPGRVNLIGEHTDYHDGFVFPAAIDRHVRAVGSVRKDNKICLYSDTFKNSYEFSLGGSMSDVSGWARRAEGIVRTVLADIENPTGLDIYLDADLPVGGGLSSSAASMAVLGRMAAEANGIELETTSFARVLQKAEHDFAGLKCGIMDQLAVLCGEADHAFVLDCRSLKMTQVALPKEWFLVVMDTTVKHDLASSEYNKRQQECATVVHELKKMHPYLSHLRDADHEMLEEVAGLCDPIAIRRCRHVVDENLRVHDAVSALQSGDATRVGYLFTASHKSLRDDYEVSCKELDALAEAAWDAPGCIGARMTGGGFGGSTVNLVEKDKTELFVDAVLDKYQKSTGIEAKAIITAAADGLTVDKM